MTNKTLSDRARTAGAGGRIFFVLYEFSRSWLAPAILVRPVLPCSPFMSHPSQTPAHGVLTGFRAVSIMSAPRPWACFEPARLAGILALERME